ncbi:hypothetical protein L861_06685 [Litchfieldella anticariensis FP35 = DSM 16096]|uniref:Integrating conjugative element protein n=1 Tax=Litchfieldella anticariensis (strain DSM 16096 / CECT 5854 / CIP 108499 / LMG 22089 / FP35) TaxID=1121939 RepID=S2L7A8_LITA3|nr:TIGR03756 family integrating conjugative element protein [Halomonas anticariensis]EPC00621.1 hypothetical protein L861_06685 [Halomonas anticariensis FP35 = DSM 16096]
MTSPLTRQTLSIVLTAGLGVAGATTSPPAKAIDTLTITESAISPECLDYRMVGVCVWLYCSWSGCRVRTSIKVRHYIPELVVSSYENTGDNPWQEMALVSPPTSGALAGGRSTSEAEDHLHEGLRFKNVDAIGHPGNALFSRFVSRFGYSCSSPAEPFMPYFLSTLDALAWRSGIPEMAYPEALIPGRRDLGQPGDMWGNVYPRSGFLTQTHDYKAAATMAQRAADIVTRDGQPHVYQSLTPSSRPGYWPPDPVVEGDASTHRWQSLTPSLSRACVVWPDRGHADTYADRLEEAGDYAWTLWRPYSCCKRRGQTLLTHTGG